MANTSLYDLAVLYRTDAFTGLIEDVTTLAPEFGTIGAVTREGTWYEVASRTTLPTAQFRIPNQGVATSKSTYKKQVKQMFFLDVELQQDQAVWKADPANVGTLWQLEAAGAMGAAGILLGQQTWYGTTANSSGFTGVRNQLAYTVSVGTGTSTSAYLVWMDEKEGCRYDVGMGGEFAISAPRLQQVLDASSNPYMAYVGNLSSWIGFNVGSSYACWSIKGIAAGATSTWLTDDAVAQLIAKIPVARRNNLRLWVNRTAHSTLQRSRSTINLGIPSGSALAAYISADTKGLPAFSPLPEATNGIPITLTDSILDTESN
jgi:hypothetical protein